MCSSPNQNIPMEAVCAMGGTGLQFIQISAQGKVRKKRENKNDRYEKNINEDYERRLEMDKRLEQNGFPHCKVQSQSSIPWNVWWTHLEQALCPVPAAFLFSSDCNPIHSPPRCNRFTKLVKDTGILRWWTAIKGTVTDFSYTLQITVLPA